MLLCQNWTFTANNDGCGHNILLSTTISDGCGQEYNQKLWKNEMAMEVIKSWFRIGGLRKAGYTWERFDLMENG